MIHFHLRRGIHGGRYFPVQGKLLKVPCYLIRPLSRYLRYAPNDLVQRELDLSVTVDNVTCATVSRILPKLERGYLRIAKKGGRTKDLMGDLKRKVD